MQTFKIATLGEGNKSAYDASGNRYFIAKRFRTNIKVGDYMLVVSKEYSEVQKNADGDNVLDAKGQPIPTGGKFWRDDVTMIGTFQEVTIAKNESAINAGLESAIVSREVKKLAKEFSLDKELEAASAAI